MQSATRMSLPTTISSLAISQSEKSCQVMLSRLRPGVWRPWDPKRESIWTWHLVLACIPPAGVLQVEAMAQLGGIILMDPEKDAESQQNFFFGGIEGCKFRRPVVPGDTLVSLKLERNLEKQIALFVMSLCLLESSDKNKKA